MHDYNKFYAFIGLGGGVRGRISVEAIIAFEKTLGKPIYEVFDLIAGTSTGGILACGLSLGYSGEQLATLYDRHAKDIFKKTAKWKSLFGILKSKHQPDGIEWVMDKYFEDKKVEDCKTDILVTAYDTETATPVIFKNTEKFRGVKLKDIAIATASAPTYLPPKLLRHNGKKMALIDGGIYANNPVMCAIAEGLKKGYKPEDIVVVSLGTGHCAKKYSYDTVRRWGLKNWFKQGTDNPLITMMMDATNDVADYQARQILNEECYFPMQIDILDIHKQMDDASRKNMNVLANYGREMVQKYTDEIEFLADVLQKNTD